MVAIKDMEMPRVCYECPVKEKCQVGIYDGWRIDKRADDCPLVEIEERKVGKWIEHNQTTVDGSRDYIECSCCKVWFGKWEMPRNSYCPNCGAEMESKE